MNLEERGKLLGAFKGDDKLLICTFKGTIKAVTPELSLHFDDNIYHIEKWNPKKPLTAIYFDPDKQRYFIKRFVIENSDKEDSFIKENGKLVYFITEWRPVFKIIFEKPRGKDHLKPLEINAEEFISVKGFKAFGNQITSYKIKKVELKEVLEYKEDEIENPLEIEVKQDEIVSGIDDQNQIKIDF